MYGLKKCMDLNKLAKIKLQKIHLGSTMRLKNQNKKPSFTKMRV